MADMPTKLVPREPTEDMVHEGVHVLSVTGGNPWADVKAMWRAMYDAAPVAAAHAEPAPAPAPAAPLDALIARLSVIAQYERDHDRWNTALDISAIADDLARLKLPSEGQTLRFNAEPPEDCPCASQCLHVGNCLGKCSAATRAAPSEGPTCICGHDGKLVSADCPVHAAPSEGPTRAEVEFAETGLIDGEATCPACGKRGWHECPANAAARAEPMPPDIAEIVSRRLGDMLEPGAAPAAARADAGAEDAKLIAATLRKRFRDYEDGLMNQAAVLIDQLLRDAERLSWIDRDDIELSFGADDSGGPFVVIRDSKGRLLACTCDIRSAIDAAMETAPAIDSGKPPPEQT